MTQETKDFEYENKKNTIALIGMILSIIGFFFFISIIGLKVGIILLTIGLILGIIGLFYKPKLKARIAITFPVIATIIFIVGYNYIKNSTPASEFSTWFEDISDNKLYSDILNDNEFLKLAQDEFKKTIKSKHWSEIKESLNYSEGSNIFEKWIYIFFDLKKESLENSLEKYNLNTDVTNINDENTGTDEENLDKDEESDKVDNEEKTDGKNDEEEKNETIEIFNKGEKNDIEEIINILE